MKLNFRLRPRVALAFSTAAVSAVLVLGTGMYMALRDLEARLINDALYSEVQDYLTRLSRNPHSLPPITATVRGYLVPPMAGTEPVPTELANLPLGYHDLRLGASSFRVAVVAHDGQRLIMLHERTQTEQIERRFLTILAIGVILTILFSAALGVWLAGRVIAPVTELARRLRELRPEEPPPRLAQDFPKDELGEMAQTFDHYLGRLRAFIEREQAFAAAASHELRTPLAVIRGAVELLLADPDCTGRNRTRAERIDRTAREMGELTSALLVLARESAKDTPPAPLCPVSEVLNELAARYRPLLQNRPAHLELLLKAEPSLPVARPLLMIALGNLIRNACLYTHQGQITVRLLNDMVMIEDTGPGIPVEDLPGIFDLRPGHHQSGGSGIGLPLVKRIADYQGWRLDVQPRIGGGMIFCVDWSITENG